MNRLPSLTAKKLVAALKRAGFLEVRIHGSHITLHHPINDVVTTVALHPGDMPRPTLKAIIKQSGMTEQELRDLL